MYWEVLHCLSLGSGLNWVHLLADLGLVKSAIALAQLFPVLSLVIIIAGQIRLRLCASRHFGDLSVQFHLRVVGMPGVEIIRIQPVLLRELRSEIVLLLLLGLVGWLRVLPIVTDHSR